MHQQKEELKEDQKHKEEETKNDKQNVIVLKSPKGREFGLSDKMIDSSLYFNPLEQNDIYKDEDIIIDPRFHNEKKNFLNQNLIEHTKNFLKKVLNEKNYVFFEKNCLNSLKDITNTRVINNKNFKERDFKKYNVLFIKEFCYVFLSLIFEIQHKTYLINTEAHFFRFSSYSERLNLNNIHLKLDDYMNFFIDDYSKKIITLKNPPDIERFFLESFSEIFCLSFLYVYHFWNTYDPSDLFLDKNQQDILNFIINKYNDNKINKSDLYEELCSFKFITDNDNDVYIKEILVKSLDFISEKYNVFRGKLRTRIF